ncbi:MAG: hypothetical protein DMG34_04520 [Acidobacteria bacterium]|nr:MAG: hypothetical protein DMG34_04520 [Acidobacteriota bacterium]
MKGDDHGTADGNSPGWRNRAELPATYAVVEEPPVPMPFCLVVQRRLPSHFRHEVRFCVESLRVTGPFRFPASSKVDWIDHKSILFDKNRKRLLVVANARERQEVAGHKSSSPK